MYAEFFGLRELPFNNTPDPRFFFSTPDHDEALASLIYAVKERKGFVLLTGEVGAGKTLVSRLMLRHFGSELAFANISHAIESAADLMESLCAEFELPCERGSGNTPLVRALHDYLLARFARNIPVVLILDEAQNLPVEAFEQLRMIGNLEADDAKLLQIAILGHPELRTLFQSPMLRQLRQRIFRSFHLPALDQQATEGYIGHRLAVAGGAQAKIFSRDAVDAIHRYSRGLPRLINALCDNAMLSAYSADRRDIDGEFVETVARQMMPTVVESAEAPGIGAGKAPDAAGGGGPPRKVQSAASAHNAAGLVGSRPSESSTAMAVAPTIDAAVQATQRNLDAAVIRAQAGCERLSSLLRSADDAVDRAVESQRALAIREDRIRRMLEAVREASGGLRPVLEELQGATECSRREQRAAREIHDRLGRRMEASREILEEFSQCVRRMTLRDGRSAGRPPNPPRTTPMDTAARALRSPEDSNVVPVASTCVGEPGFQRLLQKTQESLADLRESIRLLPTRGRSLLSHAEPVRDDSPKGRDRRPVIRLVQEMEHLAELVNGGSTIPPAFAAGGGK